MVELTIIILGYNQKDKVHNLLSCLAQQVSAPNFEVIYTDDGSTDGTIDFLLNQRYPFPFLIADRNPIHSNRSVARNRGAKLAKSDWLLFLDGDGELNDIFLQEMWRNKRENEVIQSSIQVHPNALCPARIYEVSRSTAKRFGSQTFDPRLLQSGCFLIEKKLFWKIGGFDERFCGRSGEDVAFGIMLSKNQIVTRSVPTAVFYHNHYRTIEELYQVKYAYASQGIPRILEISKDFFYKARLHTVFRIDHNFTSNVFQKIFRFFLSLIPLRFLFWISETFHPRLTVKTVIPFLCYHATVFGFEKYVRSGTIDKVEI